MVRAGAVGWTDGWDGDNSIINMSLEDEMQPVLVLWPFILF